jgi:hypothetical protein
MKNIKRIVRHYRRFDGIILCGNTSTRIEATSVLQGVSCKKCLAKLLKELGKE